MYVLVREEGFPRGDISWEEKSHARLNESVSGWSLID